METEEVVHVFVCRSHKEDRTGMVDGGRNIRTSRPGRMSSQEDSEDAQRAKQSNLERYVERVRAGLPLFEGSLRANDVGSGAPGMSF